MTNFEKIKNKIQKMNVIEMIEYMGGNNCTNIICKEIHESSRCNPNSLNYDCDCEKCIKDFLEGEVYDG